MFVETEACCDSKSMVSVQGMDNECSCVDCSNGSASISGEGSEHDISGLIAQETDNELEGYLEHKKAFDDALRVAAENRAAAEAKVAAQANAPTKAEPAAEANVAAEAERRQQPCEYRNEYEGYGQNYNQRYSDYTADPNATDYKQYLREPQPPKYPPPPFHDYYVPAPEVYAYGPPPTVSFPRGFKPELEYYPSYKPAVAPYREPESYHYSSPVRTERRRKRKSKYSEDESEELPPSPEMIYEDMLHMSLDDAERANLPPFVMPKVVVDPDLLEIFEAKLAEDAKKKEQEAEHQGAPQSHSRPCPPSPTVGQASSANAVPDIADRPIQTRRKSPPGGRKPNPFAEFPPDEQLPKKKRNLRSPPPQQTAAIDRPPAPKSPPITAKTGFSIPEFAERPEKPCPTSISVGKQGGVDIPECDEKQKQREPRSIPKPCPFGEWPDSPQPKMKRKKNVQPPPSSSQQTTVIDRPPAPKSPAVGAKSKFEIPEYPEGQQKPCPSSPIVGGKSKFVIPEYPEEPQQPANRSPPIKMSGKSNMPEYAEGQEKPYPSSPTVGGKSNFVIPEYPEEPQQPANRSPNIKMKGKFNVSEYAEGQEKPCPSSPTVGGKGEFVIPEFAEKEPEPYAVDIPSVVVTERIHLGPDDRIEFDPNTGDFSIHKKEVPSIDYGLLENVADVLPAHRQLAAGDDLLQFDAFAKEVIGAPISSPCHRERDLLCDDLSANELLRMQEGANICERAGNATESSGVNLLGASFRKPMLTKARYDPWMIQSLLQLKEELENSFRRIKYQSIITVSQLTMKFNEMDNFFQEMSDVIKLNGNAEADYGPLFDKFLTAHTVAERISNKADYLVNLQRAQAQEFDEMVTYTNDNVLNALQIVENSPVITTGIDPNNLNLIMNYTRTMQIFEVAIQRLREDVGELRVRINEEFDLHGNLEPLTLMFMEIYDKIASLNDFIERAATSDSNFAQLLDEQLKEMNLNMNIMEPEIGEAVREQLNKNQQRMWKSITELKEDARNKMLNAVEEAARKHRLEAKQLRKEQLKGARVKFNVQEQIDYKRDPADGMDRIHPLAKGEGKPIRAQPKQAEMPVEQGVFGRLQDVLVNQRPFPEYEIAPRTAPEAVPRPTPGAAAYRPPKATSGAAPRAPSGAAPRTPSGAAPRAPSGTAPRATSGAAPRATSGAAPRTPSGADPRTPSGAASRGRPGEVAARGEAQQRSRQQQRSRFGAKGEAPRQDWQNVEDVGGNVEAQPKKTFERYELNEAELNRLAAIEANAEADRESRKPDPKKFLKANRSRIINEIKEEHRFKPTGRCKQ